MNHDPARAVPPLQAVRRTARAADAPMLLAVSGGLDSMALLHAMAAVARSKIAAVATMDHGTGPAATAAAALVARTAAALELPVVMERLEGMGATPDHAARASEAEWRRERYRFLRAAAASLDARVVTAHTEDDHLETVLMRVLRGSGARGLAGLHAPSDVIRPFLAVRREALASYARGAGLRWIEDPSNRSPRFFRNRVRHDLLPALRRVDPSIDAALLGLSRRAAEWRASVETFVDECVRPRHLGAQALAVGAAELSDHDRDSLGVLWGSLAGRVGLALDRRGTQRLTAFTTSLPTRGSVPLSGGWRVDARQGSFVLRRCPLESDAPASLPTEGDLRWGGFRFRVANATQGPVSEPERTDSWRASFSFTEQPLVRSWGAGDRLGIAGGQPPRRVKRYLSEAGLRGLDRAGWPVVVAGGAGGDDVVWIPGVRRSDAATARSGRPVRHYICERIDR